MSIHSVGFIWFNIPWSSTNLRILVLSLFTRPHVPTPCHILWPVVVFIDIYWHLGLKLRQHAGASLGGSLSLSPSKPMKIPLVARWLFEKSVSAKSCKASFQWPVLAPQWGKSTKSYLILSQLYRTYRIWSTYMYTYVYIYIYIYLYINYSYL